LDDTLNKISLLEGKTSHKCHADGSEPKINTFMVVFIVPQMYNRDECGFFVSFKVIMNGRQNGRDKEVTYRLLCTSCKDA